MKGANHGARPTTPRAAGGEQSDTSQPQRARKVVTLANAVGSHHGTAVITGGCITATATSQD